MGLLPPVLYVRLGRPLDEDEVERAVVIERLLAFLFIRDAMTLQLRPRLGEVPPELLLEIARALVEDPYEAVTFIEEALADSPERLGS